MTSCTDVCTLHSVFFKSFFTFSFPFVGIILVFFGPLNLFIQSVIHSFIYPSNPHFIHQQDILSPYNINTISSRQVTRIEKRKISSRGRVNGLLVKDYKVVDPIPNSPNQHDKSCMAESRENY